jgi:2-isopropylmalate synthase
MIHILDTTLREGEQTVGVYFDSHIKLAIATLLDRIGINVIEAGHPAVSQEICKSVRQIARSNLRAQIAAHSRSLRRDVDQALDCGVDFLGIFFCVSDDRLQDVFKKGFIQALSQIADTIRYTKEQNPRIIVRYTPEDTVRSDFENVVKVSVSAVKAGADIISISDTTGFMIPGTKRSMYDYIVRLKQRLSEQGINPLIAVHCHNDRGCALANALDAYRAGVDIIDAAVLGIGERAGIVDLGTLITVLQADFGEGPWRLDLLPELYELVSTHARIPIPVYFPVTGKNAFTHCAGVHTQAALRNPMHYQSLDPSILGRQSTFALDHMSGLASVQYALRHIGENVDEELALRVLSKVKAIGQTGRCVDFDELKQIVYWCKGNLTMETHDGNAG